ncbi:MAG: S-layer homology domain-containing protein [Phormidesmis sp.]
MHLVQRLALPAITLTLPFSFSWPSYGQTQAIGLGSFQESALFTDTGDHWAKFCIEGVGTEGLIKGYLDRSFRPDGTMTRTEFAAVMIQAFPNAPKVREAPNFSDVAADFWGRSAIATAYEKGFLTGYPDNTFKPAQPISRVQAIVVIANAQALSPSANSEATLQQYFDDAQAIPNYAKGLVAAATEQAFVVNYPTVSQLRPNANITRAEATALLCRLNSAGTDARYFVPNRYVANFGSDVSNIALPPSTALHEITAGIYGLLHTHVALNNKLFFFISNNLWTSDGTPAGTQLMQPLKDIVPKLTLRNPKMIASSAQRFWFIAGARIEESPSTQLFSSDGTPEGTISIATLHPELPALINKNYQLLHATETIGNNQLPFIVTGDAGPELWVTDGETAAGTQRLATFYGVEQAFKRELIYGEVPVPLTVSGEYLYFQATSLSDDNDSSNSDRGRRLALWRSDGTVEGTISLGAIADPIAIDTIRSAPGNQIYAQTDASRLGWALWTSDGTSGGTQLLLEGESQASYRKPKPLTTLGDRFFTLIDLDSGLELWVTGGEPMREQLIKRMGTAPDAPTDTWFAVEQKKLFFNPAINAAAGPQPFGSGSDVSYELWVTEGTPDSTQKLADVQVSPEGFTAFKGRLFFSGTSADGNELWTTDGTPEGTYQVIDLVPGVDYRPPPCLPPPQGVDASDYCPPEAMPRNSYVRSLTVHGDFLYFIADDSDLFRTDGTAKNIQHVQSFISGPVFRSFPSNIVKVGDTLFVMGYGDAKPLLWSMSE